MAGSIAELGLLQPILVDEEHRLIAGYRRYLAVKKLGWATVPAVCVDGLDDVLRRLKAEQHENTCRKAFTHSEAISVGMAIEAMERGAAHTRMSEGGKGKESFLTFDRGQTRDKVGAAVGRSGKTYEGGGSL